MQEHLEILQSLFLPPSRTIWRRLSDWEASGDLLIDNDFTNGAYTTKSP